MSTTIDKVSNENPGTPGLVEVETYVLTSPFDGMDIPWTEESIAEFNRVLSEYETD